MRLLHTTNLRLEKFPSPKHPDDGTSFRLDTRTGKAQKPPEYAILSHRWSENEVSFIDISTGVHQNTEECYAYLFDVVWKPKGSGSRLTKESPSGEPSDWFTRGWTLQELLAPGTPCKSNDKAPSITNSTMFFFDQNWTEIGQKADADLCTEISQHSLIRPEYIRSPGTHKNASIAMKMSWAARRSTEKLEDRVYSLFGVFDLQMSVLYGEGEANALMRLQLELIARSDDQSIFAWVKPSGYDKPDPCGMLATSLDDFENSNEIVNFPIKDKEKPLYHMTKEGLEFRVFNGWRTMNNLEGRSSNRKETIMLACKSSDGRNVDRHNVVVINLERKGDSLQRVSYGKWNLSDKFSVTTSKWWVSPGLRRVFYVKQS
ncbi:hypothetical protein JMJ35_010634 [Cladonia borealis]|uniref:Heterokaryon incompatibility domain-containing protein n=1 Tax=Cladonia borealis TaxID=184061 RepID=A0AA39QR74_9LECA|nr:hypothetical protein JMJ35_010634 [Cladonia borealis]